MRHSDGLYIILWPLTLIMQIFSEKNIFMIIIFLDTEIAHAFKILPLGNILRVDVKVYLHFV